MINVDLVVQYAREDKALSSSLAKEAIRALADEVDRLKQIIREKEGQEHA
ncbi:hypothetical protein [Cohnella sp. JJ-181]|nr:hypothetical protein [Cohnella sp. JJ-181]CAI6073256.1 hypothetical protein COHCIP112018_02378 [Cohnella sp. JJ-181]